MRIPVDFVGMRWQRHPLAGQNAHAEVSHNNWRRGRPLEPLRAGRKSTNVPTADFTFARGFHIHDDQVIATVDRVDAATTQIVRDVSRRWYYVDNGILQYLVQHEIGNSYPTPLINGHRAGVQAPPLFPTPPAFVPGLVEPDVGVRANVLGPDGLGLDEQPTGINAKETAFVVTYVNRFGEEGPPSFPSKPVIAADGEHSINVQILSPATNDPDIIGYRIYMIVAGEYFRVGTPEETHPGSSVAGGPTYADVPNLTGLINPNSTMQVLSRTIPFNTSSIRDLLVSAEWDQPPTGLKHMASLENGGLAMADDHNVYFAEPYNWHAAPARYTRTVTGTIKRLARISGGLAVLTDEDVVFFVGGHPEDMQELSQRYPHAIADPNSLVELDGGIGYVTHDGFATVATGRGEIATDQWIDRQEWLDHVDINECRCELYDGRVLLATRTPDGTPIGYALNLAIQEVTSFDLSESALKSGFWRDPRTNETLYVIDSQGLGVFNEGDPLLAIWESGDIVIPRATNLTSYQVEAESYPVTLDVRVDGRPNDRRQVQNQNPGRIKATGRKRRARVRIEASRAVASAALATDHDYL